MKEDLVKKEHEIVNTSNNSNNKNGIIVFLVVIIIALMGAVVYFAFIKKDKPSELSKPQDNISIQENESKNSYHIVDGEEYVIYNSASSTNKKISFDYPQFDIDNNDLKRANNEIKKLYEEKYNNLFKNSINPDDGDYYVNKNNKQYGSSEVYIPEYNISETDKYISILILNVRHCNCSGETNGYGYVYDKMNKKLLSNEEILNLFNVTPQDFIQYYNQYGGCQADNDSISSLDNQKILIKDKQLYFENSTCCCREISKYGETY